jgi:hypothetical protein
MNYIPKKLEERTTHLRRAIDWSAKVVLGVVGVGLFRSEVERVRTLPHDVINNLYLALLAATLLLTAGWILVSLKELTIICEWLDPMVYDPPDETLVGLGIAVALSALFFASRSPLWFGVSYSVYTAINLAAVIHLRKQMVDVIARSRARLDVEPPAGAQLYRRAIDLLELYYVKRPNTLRVAATLALALAGLALSIVSQDEAHASFKAYAYVLYLTSLVVLEGLVAFVWRARLYGGVRPLAAAKHELERASAPA